MPVIVSDPVAVPEQVAGAPFLTAADVAASTGGTIVRAGRRPIRGAAVDSRRVRPGELFFALPGERTDGHEYLADAVAAGASGLVVTRPLDEGMAARDGDEVTIVRVVDGLVALQQVATAWRRRFDLPVVGVTGSVAKSSTKEAIATLLATRRAVLRSEGNENNEIGVPLTILRLGPEHDVAVLEMGMYVPGDIAVLCRVARPSIGVVTAVRPIHLSRAGTIEAIETGKAELVEALPRDGLAVLNADDPRVRAMAARTAARTATYGFAPGADVRADAVASRGFDGMAFDLVVRGARRPVLLPRLGRHAVHNALAAAAVAGELGLDVDEIARGLGEPWALPHRSAIVRLGDVTVIDDSYNAGPDSMLAALETLAGLPGRHIAVLGEMAELGELAEASHRDVGTRAGRTLDLLVAVGEARGVLADAAIAAGLPADAVLGVADAEAALAAVGPRLRPGDVVLVKASRSVGLERVAEGLATQLARISP
jgi:UDP-N-acetylmuramoyl-tripeptide--D-alanyl-D-alanine ligase